MAWDAPYAWVVGAELSPVGIVPIRGGDTLLVLQEDHSGVHVAARSISTSELTAAFKRGGLTVTVDAPSGAEFLVNVTDAEDYCVTLRGKRMSAFAMRNASYVTGEEDWDPAAWLQALVYFIPRSLLEPWYGDLCEDRARMALAGNSRTFIRCATTAQLAILILGWLKVLSLETIERIASGFFRSAK